MATVYVLDFRPAISRGVVHAHACFVSTIAWPARSPTSTACCTSGLAVHFPAPEIFVWAAASEAPAITHNPTVTAFFMLVSSFLPYEGSHWFGFRSAPLTMLLNARIRRRRRGPERYGHHAHRSPLPGVRRQSSVSRRVSLSRRPSGQRAGGLLPPRIAHEVYRRDQGR